MAAVLQSRPVGALACQRDSYLRSLEAEVISCERTTSLAKSNVPKNSKAAPETTPTDLWSVEFTDSVLFPEGGGQPTDHGSLEILSDGDNKPSNRINVSSVQRDGLRSICHSDQYLEPGLKVRQNVDSDRRWDHMQQHTGQHLLSAVMDTYDNLETLGWGMGQAGSSNYVDLPRAPSKDELRKIERRCNDIIRDNLAIDVLYPEGDGVAASNGGDKHEKGVIRVIKIGDVDSNPCCGTHLRQTSHISLLLLQSTQSIRGGKATRLSFVAGARALDLARSCTAGIARLAYDLSCGTGADDVVGAVDKIRADRAELRRKEVRLLKEVARVEAARVEGEMRAGRSAVVWRGGEGMEFVNMVVFELKRAVKEVEGVVAVVAVGEERRAGQVVVVGPGGAVEGFARALLESGIEVKGNGKGERWQGKVVEWRKGDVRKLEELVKRPLGS